MPPPSSGGITTAQILKLLEPFDFSPYTPDSPEYIHLFAEACKLAFADRSQHLGDPAFYGVPSTLLSEEYLSSRRDLIEVSHATPSSAIPPGSPPVTESESTTHYSVCDRDGNMVAITYTINQSYGSYLVVDGAGFLLNDEMDDFSIKPGVPNTYGLVGGEANKIEPGKRMLSSMAPTLVTKNDKPFLALGSAGGSKIITAVAQALIEIIRFDLTPGEAVSQPHFHHQWQPDLLYLEEGKFDINVRQALIRYGYTINERTPYGDLELIQINVNGKMVPASDPRRNGSTAGY
jgi:gamma-glutamyltranspeptidase/glutathione hydrolase